MKSCLMRYLISALFLISAVIVSAQVQMFQKGFGTGGYAFMLRQTSDSGFILTSGYGWPSRPILIKTDKQGDLQWTRSYYVTGGGVSTSVEKTLDGGFVIAGINYDSISTDRIYFAAKINSSGVLQWAKRYFPNDVLMAQAVKIKPTNDSGFVMVADVWDISGMSWYQVSRLDKNGNLLWQTDYNKGNKSSVYDIELASSSGNNGYVIVGQLYPVFSIYDSGILVTRIGEGGNIIWTKSFFDPNGSSFQGGYSIKRLNDGGYIITGYYEANGNDKLFGLKLDSGGLVLWSKYYDSPCLTYGTGVIETSDNGYLFTGYSVNYSPPGKDAIMIKTDYNGVPQWSRGYGSHRYEEAYSVVQTNDGGYAFCGYEADSSYSNRVMYLVKTNSTGGSGCNDFPYPINPISFSLIDSVENTLINTSSNVFSTNPVVGNFNLSTADPCALIGINETSGPEFKIYPNPTTGMVQIELERSELKMQIEVIDLLGNHLFRVNEGANITELDLSSLSKGTYFIRITTQTTSHIEKLIIQ
jgi:hypothetical protein